MGTLRSEDVGKMRVLDRVLVISGAELSVLVLGVGFRSVRFVVVEGGEGAGVRVVRVEVGRTSREEVSGGVTVCVCVCVCDRVREWV